MSLLGRKPDGVSEFSFYSFAGRCEAPSERGKRPLFQEWLNQRHPALNIIVVEHPTIDFKPLSTETVSAIGKDIEHLLSDGQTVVLIDSGGETRAKGVCRTLGFVEDPRTH